MTVIKRILVLANSMKNGGRCIAGREIFLNTKGNSLTGGWIRQFIAGRLGFFGGSEFQIGGWVRPVSSVDGKAVKYFEQNYQRHQQVKVRDFAEVRLKEEMKDRCQPENWRLASVNAWRRIDGVFAFPPLDQLEEFPDHLWLSPGQKTDRVAHRELIEKPPSQSLTLIRPEDFRIKLSSELIAGVVKRWRRCLFRYRGVDYDISMTDPEIGNRYAEFIPPPGAPAAVIRLPDGDPRLICVSLACEFHEFHFKVVATIFER